ncbi:right-handed parallel beta-helix repeat-containing protein [bacterium]|nr:right-handed parallel beta-helix repeat-containing protein [bacterium]
MQNCNSQITKKIINDLPDFWGPGIWISTHQNGHRQAVKSTIKIGIRLSHSSPKIRHCIFKGNISLRGGGIFFHESVALEILECIFEENTANEGGGIYSQRSISPRIKQCTIKNNLAHISGGGILCNSSTPEFYSNEFTDNKPDDRCDCDKIEDLDRYQEATDSLEPDDLKEDFH